MLAASTSSILATFTLLLVCLNTIFWGSIVFLVGIAKLILPLPGWQLACARLLVALAEQWININCRILTLTQPTRMDIEIPSELSRNGWYLVVANHNSWADIPVLQTAFNGKIPFLKFFLKKELIWVPILGFAWWALDFPFLERYSKAQLEKNPALKGRDLETIRRACEKFKQTPTSIIAFLEGTRFSRAKQQQRQSPYRNLLPPKVGGISGAIEALGEQLNGVLDVTISYSKESASFWDLLGGGISEVKIRATLRPIPAQFIGQDYASDLTYQQQLQDWINHLWQEKDQLLDQMKE